MIRKECLEALELDIIGIAETHLLKNNYINIEGFKWYGNNRKQIHRRAPKGSGGVGIFVKNTLFEQFNVEVLDSETEGILWISLKHKVTKECLNFCICYLPPANSTRAVNAQEYFDVLMSQMYEYQSVGQVTIFGDFNTRIGDNLDFIPGVDFIPERDIKDYQINQYCDTFINFLISTNLCILNGRNCKNNDFTSISHKGSSVVDYCLVPYEKLDTYCDFEVIRSRDLIERCLNIQSLENIVIPDHAILTWKLCINTYIEKQQDKQGTPQSYVKYDCSNIPHGFMGDNEFIQSLESLVHELESNQQEQQCLDNIYDSFCIGVKSQMDTHLYHKRVILNGRSNKKRRTKKPWWTEELSALWNDVCTSEKQWLKSDISTKSNLKHIFVNKRKLFDRAVQQRKRAYWREVQDDLLSSCKSDPNEFWKKIGKVGVGTDRSKNIPMEVKLDNGSVSNDVNDVLNSWKEEFEKLYNQQSSQNRPTTQNAADGGPSESAQQLNEGISIMEVKKAVCSLNRNRATGHDMIPGDVLRSDACIFFLHRLFCVCFETGKMPQKWSYGIINPIQKCATSDPREPGNYRGITITSAVYKAYCSILNSRLSDWAEQNNKVIDNQNGFRKQRSTMDHLSTLTSIIENRKRQRKSTFVGFVDFRKAYDTINRDLLWSKLVSAGISGKMMTAIKSLYNNVKCSVRINGHMTDWFDVNSGLKQGCILSPLMFNLFIDDLGTMLEHSGKGVSLGNMTLSCLFYADDLILIAETEEDLQQLFDILSIWCDRNMMQINTDKTKVIHYRNNAVQRSNYVFKCGNNNIEYSQFYKYLGLVLDEFLDYSVTAKYIAQSATRALGLLISKFKVLGGMPYEVFTGLYDNMVWSTISYGAAIWGTKEFSAINAVQNRAIRFFLGVGRYTPNVAVGGEMGWVPAVVKQWKNVLGHWFRLNAMDDNRINKKVFNWSFSLKQRNKNWCFQVENQFKVSNSLTIMPIKDTNYSIHGRKCIINELQSRMFVDFQTEWNSKLLSNRSIVNNNGGNKLRTYRFFMHICNLSVKY